MTQIKMADLHKYFTYLDGHLFWNIAVSRNLKGSKAGCIRKVGYEYITINTQQYRTHRLIYLYHHGILPSMVDHINGNKLDNRIENLREATNSQNQMNRGASCRSKSKIKGVSQVGNRWRATICHQQQDINLGYYLTKEEATKAYNQAATQYFGEFARLNGVNNGIY